MKSKKLKSFTLSEILISLTIMTIVILTAYYAYLVLNRYFFSYQERNKYLIEINEALFFIKYDLSRAEGVKIVDSGFVLISKIDTINYLIEYKKLSRSIGFTQRMFDFRSIDIRFDSVGQQNVGFEFEIAEEEWGLNLLYL